MAPACTLADHHHARPLTATQIVATEDLDPQATGQVVRCVAYGKTSRLSDVGGRLSFNAKWTARLAVSLGAGESPKAPR
jgi:hypothetical protein